MESTQPENTKPTTQPTDSIVTYVNFDVTRLTCTAPESKPIPQNNTNVVPGAPAPPPSYYYQIPLMYNFGTPENRILNDFELEGCELVSSIGIQSKPNQQGRIEHSIMVKFDMADSDQVSFINCLNSVYTGSCFILQQLKGAVKLYDFNAQAPGGLFKSPIYRPRDEVTGDYIQGRAPSMFLKLFSRGYGGSVEQTLFTDLECNPIPWEYLRSVELKFIPLFHVKRIYCGGGKASLQMEVKSAIVTSVTARNTTTRQTATIERIKQSRPEVVSTVAAQIAKLSIDRQDQLLGNTNITIQTQQHTPDNQPTFDGITPTGRPMQQNNQHTTGSLPVIPALGAAQPTMQDFTSGAPSRPPVIPSVNIPESNQSPSFNGQVLQYN